MKHYITIGTVLLLSAVLIFNPAAKAVSNNIVISNPTSTYATLSNQYTVDYDLDSTDTNIPHGDNNRYTYDAYITVQASGMSIDSYINGYANGNITITPTIPAGYSAGYKNVSFTPYSGENFYSTAYGFSSSGCSVRILFDNLYSGDTNVITCGVIHFSITISYSATPFNLPDPPAAIYLSLSTTTSSIASANPTPEDMGYCAIIKESILNAINDNSMPFDDILNLLEDIRTQDQTNYTTIVAYLADNDTFNSTLYTWLTTVLEDNFTYLLDDTTYISSVLNAARNLINVMNNRDSLYYPIFEAALDLANTRLQTLINLMSETPAEAASMENAINQMESKQAAINDYSLPAAGNIMGNANSYVSQGTAGMNLLATILNQPLYILILMTVISLAFVSYLLYGKGV